MKIGLRLFHNPAWMGGVHYVLSLAHALRALPAGERPHVTLLVSAPAAQAIADAHADLGDAIAPFQDVERLGLDFVYPATQLPEAPFGAPWAGWIPDWQCRHMPELFNDRERARRFLQYRVLARHAPLTVVSSQMGLADTAALVPEAADRLRVLHFPAVFGDEVYARDEARLAATRARLNVPARYVIVCNQFWKHKNHLAVLEALKQVRERDVHVVMSGALTDARWPDYAAAVRALLETPEIARRASLLGPISRDDQLDLMLGAVGVLQPSRFEGWSTVVEEARALGLPSLLSEFPVHREQNLPGAAFFDPDDSAALAARLDAWFAAPPARMALAEARAAHQLYLAACGRRLSAIAAEASGRYAPAHHDLKPVAAQALTDIRADLEAGRHHLVKEDEDLFRAGVRALFREHPEQLAQFAGLVCDEASPLYPESLDALITASLVKMPAEARARFFAYAPADAAQAEAKRKLGSPAGLVTRAALGVAAHVRDHLRRRLGA